MPLPAELEALVALVPEKDREATRKKLEESTLRQEDYSRQMNALSADKAKWKEWHEKADKQFKDAQSEVATLKETVAQLERAKASSSDDGLSGDEDAAITRALREAKTDLQAAREKQSQLEQTVAGFQQQISEGKLLTAEKFEEELTRRGDNLGAAIFEIIDLQNQCMTDYQKPLDRAALVAEANKRNGDFKSAYDFLTKDFQADKIRKQIEAEYEQKYNDRIKAANLPVDQNGGEPTLGPLQSRLQKKDTGIPDDIPADGSGRMASLIAQELKAEGKG